MGKWSNVPIDLMEIVEKYLDFADKVRIRVVCKSWNSYLDNVPKLVSEELPWLLIEDETEGALLYTLHETKLYHLNLPELKHKIFKGSSCGWIVTLEDEGSTCIDDIYAFNPLTRVRIKLPPRSTFPDIQDFNPHRAGKEYIMKERHEQCDYIHPELQRFLEPEHDTNSEPEPEPEPKTNSESESEPNMDCESEPKTDSESESEPKNDSESEPESESESDFEPEAEVENDEDFESYIDPLTCKSRTNQILMRKVVMSSSPASNDCLAVAIYGEFKQLAWCKPHHKEWTAIIKYCDEDRPRNGCLADIIFHDGHLYVLYGFGSLYIYDNLDSDVIVREVVAPYGAKFCTPTYLAACPDLGLILTTRHYDWYHVDGVRVIHTRGLHIHKISDSKKTWVQVDGLGEHILFLGLNMSTLIPVSDELKALGYKKNCAYFTDHFAFDFGRGNQDDSDMGLLDIDGSFIVALPGFKLEPEYFWPPPVWVTPSAI